MVSTVPRYGITHEADRMPVKILCGSAVLAIKKWKESFDARTPSDARGKG